MFRLMERDQYWSDRDCCLWLEFVLTCLVECLPMGFPVALCKPASREIISASVELCETEVCFLHIQLIGTNVWLPKTHRTPPNIPTEADFFVESLYSAHPLPATPFQCPRSRTTTLELGGRSTACPCVGLTVHWAVSSLFQHRSTTGRWPSR